MTILTVVGAALIVIGLVASAYGLMLVFRPLRYLPKRQIVRCAFFGPVLFMSGLCIAAGSICYVAKSNQKVTVLHTETERHR